MADLSHSLALGRIGLNPGVFLFKFVEVSYIDFAFDLFRGARRQDEFRTANTKSRPRHLDPRQRTSGGKGGSRMRTLR